MARNKTDLEKQPQSIEAEEAVLGSMLTSKEAVSKVTQWVNTPDCFYKDVHAKIFSCMLALEKQGEPIDSVSVAERLKKEKKLKSVGGAYFITGLSQSVPTTANVEHYTKIVLEKYILRQLIEVSNEVSKNALYLFLFFTTSIILFKTEFVLLSDSRYFFELMPGPPFNASIQIPESSAKHILLNFLKQ